MRRRSDVCRREVVAQVGQMAEAYIELAAVPAADKANEMPFPSPIRRSTKALNKVPHAQYLFPSVQMSCWALSERSDAMLRIDSKI